MGPTFLDLDQIILLHDQQLEFFGGIAGIRDSGLLESAAVAPINYFLYANKRNLFDLAACYAFHLAKNHPFLDGNKRVALHASLTFLSANGIVVKAKQKTMFKSMAKLTVSKMDQDCFSRMLADNSPLGSSIIANLFLD